MKKIGLLLPLVAAVVAFVSCCKSEPGFAVVIDPQSYNEAKSEIDTYLEVVSSRGLKPILVIDNWGVPDSIRAKLIELHSAKKNPIEGCVFIGDIPVAMVQDAQHFTSAFKMDQDRGYARIEYCVPTDRYYDCFDLEWDYLGADSTRWFYYSLRADCPQKLSPTIYSARIAPRDNARGNKYEKLRRYMQRVSEADANNNPFDRILYFGGHSNVSDSFDARMDEKTEYFDQCPWLRDQKKSVTYLDFRRDPQVKERLKSELSYPEYDYAALHHHGSETEQLLSGSPYESSYTTDIKVIQNYLRGQVRRGLSRGKSLAEIKASSRRYLDAEIPDSWFKGTDDPEINAADEAYAYAMDLHVDEFDKFHPQCRLVSLDACYNGSFHLDESIQEAYLFGEGNGTLLAIANSVNSLQDKWINHYIGLMGLGMRAGYLVKMGTFLEYHLFGDPTFAFTKSACCGFDVNEALLGKPASFWKKQLDNEYPAVQVLALDMLTKSGEACSDMLLEKFKTSKAGIVRLAAMLDLTQVRDDNMVECLSLAIDDEQEMVQRFACNLVSDCGDPRLIEPLMVQYCRNLLPKRVDFDMNSCFHCMDSTEAMGIFEKVFAENSSVYADPVKVHDNLSKSLSSSLSFCSADNMLPALTDTTIKLKYRLSDIRTIRNYNAHHLVPQYLDFLSNPAEEKVQVVLWEALGWFGLSYRHQEIADKALAISKDERFAESVRKEALKTYNRVK